MSSQRGNVKRTRPPKFKNTFAYNNTKHDTSKRTAEINRLTVDFVCARCKDIIEWKIKYKKYKQMAQPKKCLKCNRKAVTHSYHTICSPCCQELSICGKCGESVDAELLAPNQSQDTINREFEAKLADLRERERRTLLRIAAHPDREFEKKVDNVTSQSLSDDDRDSPSSSDQDSDSNEP